MEPLPALPTPTQLVEGQGIAEPIAEPKAAKPRKAGPAKGNAKTAYAKSQLKSDFKREAKNDAESKDPKAAAAKAKQQKVSSKRKEKGR
jgi:hypothetical protein